MKRWIIVGLALGGLALMGVGCTQDLSPIERSANTVTKDFLKPVADKAVAELGTRAANITGAGSLQNPGYVLTGEVVFGTVVKWEMRLGTDGVSVIATGSVQGDQGPDLTRHPGKTEPETKPGG